MTELLRFADSGAPPKHDADKEFAHEWVRLRMILERAGPGQMIYLEVGPPRERPALVERMRREVARTFLYVHVGHEGVSDQDPDWAELPFLEVLYRTFERQEAAGEAIDICVLDGFEDRATTREQSYELMDQLNLARESLGAMPAALVFLLPPYLIQRIHQRALNLWSWRMHHIVLHTPRIELLDTGELFEPAPDAAALAEQLGRRFELARQQGLSLRDSWHAAAQPYVHALYKAGAHQRALEVLDELSADPALSGLPSEQAEVEYWTGSCWGRRHMLDHARVHLEKALALCRANPGADEHLIMAILSSLGNKAQASGAHEQAESYLLEALQRLEARHRDEFDDIIKTRLALARVYVAMGRLYEAYALLEATQDQYEARHPGQEFNHVPLLEGLSVLYNALGDHHRALALCHRLLDAGAPGRDHSHLALWQYNLARIYRDLGDDEQAQHWQQRAQATRERGQGREEKS